MLSNFLVRLAPSNKKTRGQGTVEFALTATLLLLLILGITWGAELLNAYEFVSYAAEDAARYAIVRGATSPDPATAQDISNFVLSMATTVDPNAVSVTTNWMPNNQPGSVVQVQVSYNFTPNLPLVPQINIPLSATCEMVIAQ